MESQASVTRERHHLSLDNPDAIRRLRCALEAAGYTEANLRDVLKVGSGMAVSPEHLPVYLRRVASPTPLHTLVKLFLLGTRVEEEQACAVLFPLGLQEAAAMGLVEVGEEGVRSHIVLEEYAGLWLAHDRYQPGDVQNARSDHVLGVNMPSLSLATLTVRRHVGLTLDLGTGCGIQALLTARHSDRVVATDANARALEFAAFNAALNGIANVEFRHGSLFGPVAGCRFDLIVSNPPYVVSPESQYLFRDSGLPGDSISREVISQASGYLSEGGFATVLGNWGHRTDEHWSTPPADQWAPSRPAGI